MSQTTVTSTRRVVGLVCCSFALYLAVVIAAMWAPQGASACLLGMNRELARSQLMSLLGQYPDLMNGQGMGMMGNRMPGLNGMNGMNGMGGMGGMQGMNGMGGMNGMNGMNGQYPQQGQQGMGGMGGQQGGFMG